MIDVKHLSKSFGDHLVLKDISEHIYPGDKMVIIGFRQVHVPAQSEPAGRTHLRHHHL